jgi:N-acyl-D-amino-acid deacylase
MMTPMRAAFLPVLAGLIVIASPSLPGQTPVATGDAFDVLIAGGRVFDGTGNPAAYADVGVTGGKITAVGRLAGAKARRVIDAKGKFIVPGFIDLHSHADGGLTSEDRRRRAAMNLVSQGITTVVVNPDGGGPWPLSEQRKAMERLGVGPNVALMAGHGTVRRQVMKDDFRRPATPAEIGQMRGLVRQAMQQAFGLSAGLEYVPGIWSTTEELVELVREIAPFGGAYIAHQRSESTDPRWYRPSADPPGQPSMLDAINETIEVGEQTGATVVWSHCKAMGAHYWGSSQAAIRLINRARSRGVDVWTDQYPYNSTGGDGSTVLIPAWAIGIDAYASRRNPQPQTDYGSALRQTMADKAKSEKVRRDIRHEIARRGGPENVVVFEHPDASFIGKSVDELAKRRGITPVQMALELQYEGFRDRPGGARLRGFSVWEDDVEAFMAQPWTATSTDAGIALPEDGPDVHARFYGSYPRKFRRYALERGAVSVEHAVRSSTSLAAQILGLRDRGLIRAGLIADIAVLDLERIRDRATFSDPHQYPEGVDYVLVNGRFAVDGGKLTGDLPGEVLDPRKSRAGQ